jgi:hypothetical protein
MPNFSKQIASENGLFQFFFDRISTTNGIKYHVSVRVEKNTSCHFTMEPKDGRWKIVSAPLPPSWILKLEDELSKEISNH